MRSFLMGCAILAAGMVPAAASAQEQPKPVDRAAVGPEGKMGLQVTSFAFKSLEGVVPPGKLLRLMLIAKQRALATACEAHTVDEARYAEGMTIALEDVAKQSNPGENNPAVDKVMFAFATMLGGELAISAYNPDSYCAYGDELKAELGEKPEAKLLILKD